MRRAGAGLLGAVLLAGGLLLGGASTALAYTCGSFYIFALGPDVVIQEFDYYESQSTAIHVQETLWYQTCHTIGPRGQNLTYANGIGAVHIWTEDNNPHVQWHVYERVGHCNWPTCDNSSYSSTINFQSTGNAYTWVDTPIIWVGYFQSGYGFWADDWAPSSYTWWYDADFSQPSGNGQYSYVDDSI